MRTSAASYRLHIAARFWHGGRQLFQHQEGSRYLMEPLGHLLAMGMELALKAFLTDANYTDAQLASKKIGHDLKAALRLCVQHGMAFSEAEARCILSMRHSHLTHFNRYGPRSRAGTLAMGAVLLTRDEVVVSCLASVIDRISHDPSVLRGATNSADRLEWPEAMPLLKWVTLSDIERLSAEQQKQIEAVAAINAKFGADGLVPFTP